jgi:hypothetical protein
MKWDADETGQTYRGFVDASGKRVDQIVDESGAVLDAASGWAAEKWEQAKTAVQGVSDRATGTASALADQASSAVTNLHEQTNKLNAMILHQFRDQPLVGGALAFAVGAAIGAALPSTEIEDELAGEASDATKEAISEQTSELVDQGTAMASNAYQHAVAVASDAHDDIKDRLAEEVESLRKPGAREPTIPG